MAATTSMMTGLNPSETGILGWNMYYKDIDKTITVFMNTEKENPDCEELVSHHAGYTDDEIFVPLIAIKTKKN